MTYDEIDGPEQEVESARREQSRRLIGLTLAERDYALHGEDERVEESQKANSKKP